MRGPGLRLKNDVRRLWRCPACRQERRTAASLVSVSCPCCEPNPQMQLIETIRPVRVEHAPLPPYIEYEEILGEESSAASVSDARDTETSATELIPPVVVETTLTAAEAVAKVGETDPPEPAVDSAEHEGETDAPV